jgi:hypothetical protein
MSTLIAQKLKIKEGDTLLVLNPPVAYQKSLGILPKIAIVESGNTYNQVHWFVKDKAQMDKELQKTLSLIKQDVVCWIFYPKARSKMQTDLNRDNRWEELMKHDLRFLSLISFDDTWSAFGVRQKTEKDRKKAAQPKENPVFTYVDPKAKTVTLPDELAIALNENRAQLEFFNTLSFTNKKEYIEWIVTAKRDETRKERIAETIERLRKGWKNPTNR